MKPMHSLETKHDGQFRKAVKTYEKNIALKVKANQGSTLRVVRSSNPT